MNIRCRNVQYHAATRDVSLTIAFGRSPRSSELTIKRDPHRRAVLNSPPSQPALLNCFSITITAQRKAVYGWSKWFYLTRAASIDKRGVRSRSASISRWDSTTLLFEKSCALSPFPKAHRLTLPAETISRLSFAILAKLLPPWIRDIRALSTRAFVSSLFFFFFSRSLLLVRVRE